MFLDAIHSQLSTTPRNTGSNTRLARALRERLFPRSTERGPIEARASGLMQQRLTSFHALPSVAPLKHPFS